MHADYMFWGKNTYSDGVRIPVVPYRCKSDHKGTNQTHHCKRITDHDGVKHACICGDEW